MGTLAVTAHAVIVVALIVAYALVTALGHDADALLGVLAGYLGGGTVGAIADAKRPAP